jgi:hypothetical protein
MFQVEMVIDIQDIPLLRGRDFGMSPADRTSMLPPFRGVVARWRVSLFGLAEVYSVRQLYLRQSLNFNFLPQVANHSVSNLEARRNGVTQG